MRTSALPYQAAAVRPWPRAALGWLAPAALFAGTLALYAATRSISLDDFDSFNFARAIDHFDVQLNQPQAPGYPVYVLLARLLNVGVHDHQTALTLLSAVCGAAGVLAFYGLAADLGVGWAALPLAVMPLWWLSSEMALSDVPGMAFAMAAVFLLNRGAAHVLDRGGNEVPNRGASHIMNHSALNGVNRGSPDVIPTAASTRLRGEPGRPPGPANLDAPKFAWLAGCALTGLTVGVRPQASVVPLAVLVFWCVPHLWRARAHLALGAGAFVAACLVWAVPFALTFGSPGEALRVMTGQSQYVGATDSLLARPLTLGAVGARLAEFGSAFSAYFGGPVSGGLAAFLALVAAAGVLAVAAPRTRGLALAWLVPNAALMLLAMRPDDPRKLLPAIPPLLLLLAGIRPKQLAAAACVALAAWFAFSAAPLIRVLDTEKAPPEQAAAYIAANFSPSDTAIVAGQSYNAVRDHDPAFITLLVDDKPTLQQSYRNLIVLDKEGFAVPENYVGADSRTFQRDPLVLPKASTVWMAVYHPLDSAQAADLRLPDGSVHIGTPEDVRFVSDGWYRPEDIAGVPARWTDQQARLHFWVDRPADASLELVAAAYPSGEQLSVDVNGQRAATLPLAQGWAPYNISLPATLFHAGAINTLTFEHSAVTSAYEATDGQSLDQRPLAAAYSSLELRWR